MGPKYLLLSIYGRDGLNVMINIQWKSQGEWSQGNFCPFKSSHDITQTRLWSPNSLQMAMTENCSVTDTNVGESKRGIWNHYICLLWPLIIPILTSTFLEVNHQLAVCLFDPFPDWLREVHFYWWLKVTARPQCALAVPALIPT